MHCTVVVEVAIGPWVVVAVIGGEHHSGVDTEAVASIVRAVVAGYRKLVVARFAVHNERTVLGVVPAVIGKWLKVNSQLVAAARCQLTEQFVAEPVVAARVVEPGFKLVPRTVEEV